MRTLALLVTAALLMIATVANAEIAPTGGELQVNTYTPGTQEAPAVAATPSGDFIAVWQSDAPSRFPGPDGSLSGIYGRRFAADGTPRAPQFQVNTYTPGAQQRPRVAVRAGDAFVVVWDSRSAVFDAAGSASSVFLREFDANGAPLGDDLQVNTYTPGPQQNPDVAATADGAFTVVWESGSDYGGGEPDGSGAGIFGRRFDAAGNPVGGELQINAVTTDDQRRPAIASRADGGFVVAWDSGGYRADADGDRSGVFARRFDATGAPVGGEFQVNTYTTGYQTSPAVAVQPDGGFVVVWSSDGYYQPGPDGDGASIAARRFDAAGQPVGDEFVVNAFTTSEQRDPAVTTDPLGNFVVAWSSGNYAASPDADRDAVAARHFAADGTPLGGDILVNTYATGDQGRPSVTADGAGRFVIAWDSFAYPRGQDGSEGAVIARRVRTTAFRPPSVVRGARLVLRDHPTDPTRRRLEVSSDDRGIELVAGDGLAVEDPTVGGATVRIRSRSFDDTYVLPAANWRPLRDGWQYSDPGLRAGPIRRARVRAGRLVSAQGVGAQLGHSLDATPEPVTVLFQLGTGQRWCVEFGGATHFVPHRTFRAADAPAPSDCPT
jgi:hypothetical protein